MGHKTLGTTGYRTSLLGTKHHWAVGTGHQQAPATGCWVLGTTRHHTSIWGTRHHQVVVGIRQHQAPLGMLTSTQALDTSGHQEPVNSRQ